MNTHIRPIGYTKRGQPVWPIAGGAVNDLLDRTDAGALMPEEVSGEILTAVVEQSAALQLFPRVNMSRQQRRLPVLATLPTAYWLDSDTGLKQTSKMQWANKYLDAAEIAVIVPIPDVVFDDTDYDMWAQIRPQIAAAIGEKLDASIFFGVDIPTLWTHFQNGIVPDALTAGHEVTLGDYDDIGLDLSHAMQFVEDDGFDVTGHAGPRRLRAKLRNARAAGSGEPIYQQIGDAGQGTIFGDRYAVFGNGAWDGSVLDVMGDYSQGILGVRSDINFKMFDSGVISDDNGAVILNLMQQDSQAIRVVARFAFVVANTITRQDPDFYSTTRYPFAVLEDEAS